MKSRDQQLLEEAYKEVFTSGQAFQSWKPPGGWPKEVQSNETSRTKTKKAEKAKVDDIDVEGDPVGNLVYTPPPQPEEDHTASMVFVSNEDLEKIYNHDQSLFELLFKGSEEATEKPEGIVFRYLAPQVRQKMENQIQSVLAKQI
jgi:hypothetical protein